MSTWCNLNWLINHLFQSNQKETTIWYKHTVTCLGNTFMAHQRDINVHIYSFLRKLEHNTLCDLAMTSVCGHKLTFDPSLPDFHVWQKAAQSCQPWWKEVSSATWSVLTNAWWHGHAPVRMGGPIRKQYKRQKKKSPISLSRPLPVDLWPLSCRLVLTPWVSPRSGCVRPVASLSVWEPKLQTGSEGEGCKATNRDDIILRKNRI